MPGIDVMPGPEVMSGPIVGAADADGAGGVPPGAADAPAGGCPGDPFGRTVTATMSPPGSTPAFDAW